MGKRHLRSPEVAAAVQVDRGLCSDVIALLEPGSCGPDVLVGDSCVTSHACEGTLDTSVIAQRQGQVACKPGGVINAP